MRWQCKFSWTNFSHKSGDYKCHIEAVSFLHELTMHVFLDFVNTLTLISLINQEPTLTDLKKFRPQQNKNPPSTFIEILDFSTLHSSFIRFMY